ncbi:MAG: phosphoserine transaminase [Alphaproteobacteria bacterium]|nr:phosphoserine transaminase [Alphaproteobacteria bacterium]
MVDKPTKKPDNACFSSGPCAKRPGWNVDVLKQGAFGRSHRAKIGKNKLQEVIDRSAKILGIPSDYRVGIVPGSDTGAVEMALWSLLGPRGVDVLSWESFGEGWLTDVVKQLKIQDVRSFKAPYGKLPDLSQVDCDRDVVFTWNGTTSGVKVPNSDWLKADRKGLTICDATSAVFAMELPWDKLDVVTYSWQKVLGGEGAHGMIILSPRAVERLITHTPSWPMPKVFTMAKGGKLIEGIFKGETINTPSMMCVEDILDALNWTESLGGVQALIKRSGNNLNAIKQWVAQHDWVDFLAEDPATISNTSVCLKIVAPWYQQLAEEEQQALAKELVSMLEKESVAFDIGAYRDAPAGLRIWAGATVETSDVEALLPWVEWAYRQIEQKKLANAA